MSIDRVDKIVEKFLSELEDENTIELYSKVSSGKKLRAKLILKIAGESELSYNLAAIVEMVHAASLLHDDVIDDAQTRRGKESINAIFGNKNAIMLGDILYSKAFYELTSMSEDIAKSISSAVTKLSVGELLDVTLSESFNESEEKYFDMIYKKTASLIEAASYSSALLAGLDAEKFALYGKNLGLAFQIIDDILDVTMDAEKLGKPSMHDFFEGKTTLPYIFLYQRLSESEKKRLLSLYKRKISKTEESWIKNRMSETDSIKDCIKVVNELAKEAINSISKYKNSELESIINEMINREY